VERVDAIVVGAGVVGLATACALARGGRDVLVLEAEADIGTGISSRSSEVAHAGLYYPTGSLKAQLCTAGRALLEAYCERHGVPFRRTGKLVVAANPGQHAALEALARSARANGVSDVCLLTAGEAHALEPELRCHGALLSPSTGIVDSRAFILALRGELEALGGTVALNTRVTGGTLDREGVVLRATGTDLIAGVVINAAGLGAQALARAMAGCDANAVPPLHLAKGTYFALGARAPFRHLIYPVPEAGGLGIHATLDLGGRTRFGPDIEWVDTPDYRLDSDRANAFYAAIRSYWPGLPEGALRPDYCGIRPKVSRPGGSSTDFIVQLVAQQRGAALVNLFGIESPGLTAALALGAHVAGLLERP
jgi:L-2-hydroxyglutarate oxidase LhgO